MPRSAGRLPIVVGGTGLYLKALLEGLAEVPPIPAEIRKEAEAMHAELGGAAFREELARLDPQGASRIAATDRQRLLRAFEVARWTGRPLSEWQQRCSTPSSGCGAGDFATIALLPPRERLYPTLDARLEAMLANGAVDEVRRIAGSRPRPRPAGDESGGRTRDQCIHPRREHPGAGREAGEAGDPPLRQAAVYLAAAPALLLNLWRMSNIRKAFDAEMLSFIRQRLLTGAA